jgi:SAM-dependent methyltransferase
MYRRRIFYSKASLSNKIKQVTELEFIIDLHKKLERQGPGSKNDTLKALGFLNLPSHKKLKVADIGCGSGGQTITLAKTLNAHITAVDLSPEFLNELNIKAQKLGFTNKIITLEKSMDNLQFNTAEFDLIWSEGAIYNIGFEHGLKIWKDHLKIGGYLAVSEITWLTQSRPRAIEEFWNAEYPEINTASAKIGQLEQNGYALEGYFYLSPDSWINYYYEPMQNRFESFLRRHNNSAPAKKIIADHKAEIDLYYKYKDFYSYGFYIARKIEQKSGY